MTADWNRHVSRIKGEHRAAATDPDPDQERGRIEPWLAALLQTEHLTLLVGSGLTTGLAHLAGAKPLGMVAPTLEGSYAAKIATAATRSADKLGRGTPNIEDTLRTLNDLIAGLDVLESKRAKGLKRQRDAILNTFLMDILATERTITTSTNTAVRECLGSFLLTFASRTATRERLHLATTNYDRLIEYGCDQEALHLLDRFTGSIRPIFRSSRLDLDLHYNPPGIRGEPRYLEGVIKHTKLHGSIDWRYEAGEVHRVPLDYGATTTDRPGTALLVYPNSAKDVETSHYPYADLFRDFATATCRPNSALVTYGYGFADSHINHVITDMLTIPSTHLLVIAYDDCSGRLPHFLDATGHQAQVSLLVGPHYGDLATLTQHYLPKPAIDAILLREAELRDRRTPKRPTSGTTGVPLGGSTP